MTQFFNQDGSITMVQGDTIAVSFKLSTDGVSPYDYSGQEVEFRVGRTYAAAGQLIANTENGKLEATSPTGGMVTFALLGSDTASLAPGNYVYELALYTAQSKTTLHQGVFVLRGQITNT